MKTFSTLTLMTVSAIMVVGCGRYEKHPVSDLQQIRDNGKKEMNDKSLDDSRDQRTKELERQVAELERQKAELIAKPVVRTETVYVDKPVEVVRVQGAVDQSALIINPDRKMVFVEEVSSSFKVQARSTIPGVKVNLTAKNLPEGATLTKSTTDADVYLLTWKPKLYTVAPNDTDKEFDVKFVVDVVQAPNERIKNSLNGIVREKDATLRVKRTQAQPSDLQIEGLANEVSEGVQTKFSVTVKVPGIDGQSPRKPLLNIFNDRGQATGVDYLEQDGSYHVIVDPTQREAQYVGDSKWKFSMIFDTKNLSPRPELDLRGQAKANSGGTHVRFSALVISPLGTVTPQILKQVYINLNRPVSSPRFYLASLAGGPLKLTPGETSKLNFTIESADAGANLKIELPDLKTLPGSPKLSCRASQKSAAKQECLLEWAVPCAAEDRLLTQEIAMTATAVLGGRNSEPVKEVLKTIRSEKAKPASCQTQRPAARPGQSQAGGRR